MQEKGSILTGVAEVSIKEIIALEKSVTDKDQTIGALHAQVKQLEDKIQEVKNEIENKQKQVKITTSSTTKRMFNGDYYEDRSSSPTIEYKNLDDVIENIRKEESKKLGSDIADLEGKVQILELDKARAKNEFEFEVKSNKESLRKQLANHNKDLKDIREELEEQLDEQREEIKNLKKDKVETVIEHEREQEIIDLKERIHELETTESEVINFGWFKKMIYNWLKIDSRAKIQAERENLEKKERIDNISRSYPNSKSFWLPSWVSGYYGCAASW